MALFHDLAHELNTQYSDYTGDSSALVTEGSSVCPNWYTHFAAQAVDVMTKLLGDSTDPVSINVVNGSVGRLAVELLTGPFGDRVALLGNHDARQEFSLSFQSLVQSGSVKWNQLIEGDIFEERSYSLPDSVAKEKLRFDLLKENVSFALIDGDIPKFTGIDVASVSLGGHVLLATRAPLESQAGFSLVSRGAPPAWKIAHDTIRKTRVVQLHVSVWKREEQSATQTVSSLDALAASNSAEYYENDDVVRSYERFHFDPGFLGVPNFSKAVGQFALRVAKQHKVPLGRALDIGAGPARSAIEMALGGFQDVTAIDFSHKLIDLAVKHAPSFGIPESVNFRAIVGDAHKLVSEEPYDCVIAINLIDRLETPSHFIEGIKPLISKEGILVIASPYTWHERFTPKDKWLGGFGSTTTLQGLGVALAPEFEQLGDAVDIPFVIPDPDGAYQFTKSQASVWKRK